MCPASARGAGPATTGAGAMSAPRVPGATRRSQLDRTRASIPTVAPPRAPSARASPVFRQQLAHEVVQRPRHRRVSRKTGSGSAKRCSCSIFHHALRTKRRPAGEQRIKHAAEAVEIAAVGYRAPVGLLRRHVLGRADEAAVDRLARVAEELRDAEVGKFKRCLRASAVGWRA